MALSADIVAKAFNSARLNNWRARAYLKGRANGVFNAVNFNYKGGMVQLLMDCDKPFGMGFQVKFTQFVGSFGDYCAAIQKALYKVLTALRDAEAMPTDIRLSIPQLDLADICFALRKDGAITYLRLIEPGDTLLGDDITYGDDTGDAVSVDDLL